MGLSSARTRVVAVALFTCIGAVAAPAHHSLAPYDRETTLTIEGIVKSWDFANPHVKLYLTVADAGGAATEWSFESSNVSRMTARGFNRVSARTGDRIAVRYNPRRDGSAGGYFTGFTDSRGRVYGPVQER